MRVRIYIVVLLCAYLQAGALDNYGVVFGLNDSKYKFDYSDASLNSIESNYSLSPKLGFFIEHFANSTISFKPSLAYSIRSLDANTNLSDGSSFEQVSDFHFINLGIHLNFYLLQSLSSPFINLGINSEYLIFEDNYENSDATKMQFSIPLGMGYNHLDTWFLQFDYHFPLQNLDERGSYTLKESYFSLSFGVHLNKLIQSGRRHEYDVDACPRIPQP